MVVILGGAGSGSLNDAYDTISLLQSLKDAGLEYNEELSKFYTDYKADRARVLYEQDKNCEYRVCDDSPVIKMIYDEFLEAPGKEKSHKYLHTSYVERGHYYK